MESQVNSNIRRLQMNSQIIFPNSRSFDRQEFETKILSSSKIISSTKFEKLTHLPYAIWFGIGFVNDKGLLSKSIPFDLLSYILIAYLLKNLSKATTIIHILGDFEARTNPKVNPSELDSLVENTKNKMIKIKTQLNLDNYEIILTSSLKDKKEFLAIKTSLINSSNFQTLSETIPEESQAYVSNQLAVTEYLRLTINQP